ncbi:hypothetical protein ACS5PN_19030 [Roseateles sp. NT4]|uniref:hypothetical protein n=1 Tax=Roseateles sp. NT4 TaxID=3453715 RepID=UPI003EF07F02
MNLSDLPPPNVTPSRPHWQRAMVGAAILMTLGALISRLTSCAPGFEEAAAAKERATAQLHTLSLATSIARQPPVSVAQVDELLTTTRVVRDRLRDEEARAWVMRDVIELSAARQAWQLAEQRDSLANAAQGRDAAGNGLAAHWRWEAAEYRRRAAATLWRFRQLAPMPWPQLQQAPQAVAAPASSASAAAPAASMPVVTRPTPR